MTEREKTNKDDDASAFASLASAVRRKAVVLIKRHEKLISNLNSDLTKHGDPEIWKHHGDVLLANVGTAKRNGDKIRVIDYFDPATPEIEIEGDKNLSVTDVAEDYFLRYTKARNARAVIAKRMATTSGALADARAQLTLIDDAIERADEDLLRSLLPPPKKPVAVTRKKKKDIEFKGARRFRSSDGFEILVGKKAADNDFLTFRVARSLDMWMHAADYPGSHVVIRNAGKKDIAQRTLVEAARLAAFYSDAREQTKAAVHYTLKKFVNKPRRSAPGLVSLSSFKTLLVEPGVPEGVESF